MHLHFLNERCKNDGLANVRQLTSSNSSHST